MEMVWPQLKSYAHSMNPGSKASPTILLTLAEFAWLVVFALLLLVKGTRNDLERSQAELAKVRPAAVMTERLENLESELTKSRRDQAWQAGQTEKALDERDALKLQLSKLEDSWKAQTALANTAVRERDAARTQLETLKAEVNQLKLMTKAKPSSKKQDDPDVLIASLKTKLADAEKALNEQTKVAAQSAKEREEARATASRIAADLERLKKALDGNSVDEITSRLKQLSMSEEKYATLRASHVALKSENSRLKAQLQSRSTDEFSVRQEILGIEAKNLGRVVILLDTSSSMSQSTAWKDAKRLVQVWLTHLPIEECVLVNFNSKIHVFPENGFLRIRKPDKSVIELNHQKLLKQVNDAALDTYTDTLRALEKAYTFSEADMILLFTDGKPQTSTARYETLAPRIFSLVKEHSRIPINAIGLGDYEKIESDDRKAGKNLQIHFLKEIARLSGGSFIAR
jgi:von Willebrand factor type A domain